MLARHKTSQLREALDRITVPEDQAKGRSDTTPRRRCYSTKELQYFRKIMLEMREAALSVMRECQDSVRSFESDQPVYGPREQPVSFHERSADASMREEYVIVINRQLKLLEYLDAALERIEDGSYGACICCEELIAHERLEAVPHTQLCINCKGGGSRALAPRNTWSSSGKGKYRPA
jgi:DnaK suppressor protein